MDKLDHYRQLLMRLLRENQHADVSDSTAETQVIADTESDNYQLMQIGWQGNKRIYHCFIHASIRNNKIQIEQDFTEPGLAVLLLEQGVPKSDIVLAFHSPMQRQYTDFASL
jgi:hypothetical protein